MRENNELENYRKQIDEIDKQTAKLFEARMNAVKGISAYKKTRGIAVTDKTREADVIRRNGAYISDDEIREYYVRFISSVMQISRDLQIRETIGMKAAYYGNEGSACFFAAKKAFPHASLYGYPSVIDAYRAAEQGECDCAVLPIDGDSSEDPRTVKDLAFTGSLYINAVVETKDVQDPPEGHGADSSAAKRFAVFSRVQNLLRKRAGRRFAFYSDLRGEKRIRRVGAGVKHHRRARFQYTYADRPPRERYEP